MFQKKNFSSYSFTANKKNHTINFMWNIQHSALSILSQLSISITNWESHLVMMLMNNCDTGVGSKLVEALFPDEKNNTFTFACSIKKEGREMVLSVSGDDAEAVLFKTLFEPNIDFINAKNVVNLIKEFETCYKRVVKMFSVPVCTGDIEFFNNTTHAVYPQVTTKRIFRFNFPGIYPTAILEKMLNEEIPETVFDIFKPFDNGHDEVNIDHVAALKVLSEMSNERTLKHNSLLAILKPETWVK